MHQKLIAQIPNSPPDVKSDKDKDKDKDSKSDKSSIKSQGKRRSDSDVEISPEASPIKESGSEKGYTTATASGSKDHDYATEDRKWRESNLGKRVRGMENEEDMIKQRAEMRGLIEKKTYIGLVSQLSQPDWSKLTTRSKRLLCP